MDFKKKEKQIIKKTFESYISKVFLIINWNVFQKIEQYKNKAEKVLLKAYLKSQKI